MKQALIALLLLAFTLPISASNEVVITDFALLAGFPTSEPEGTEGVLVVPGTVIPLDSLDSALRSEANWQDENERSVALLATGESLAKTLRLQRVETLVTLSRTLQVGQTELLPGATATASISTTVTLMGADPSTSAYRVQIFDGNANIADTHVTVPGGQQAVVGAIDGPEAPYLFLVLRPQGGKQSAPENEPARVWQGDPDLLPPRIVERVPPRYTADARKHRITGIVLLRALIDDEGLVEELEVLKGLPHGLDEAAKTAIRQWRFSPATRHGEPVAVYYNLTVNFTLKSEDSAPW
ncbi:MAG: energy transducer TonB [Acidobacteriota bacterium]